MKSGKSIFLAIVAMCLILVSASAQTTTGRIRGIIKDSSGALVSGAKVTVTNKSTAISKITQSSSQGEFLVSDLLPGDHKVSIEITGFKLLTLDDVRVELNQTTDVNAEMQLGITTEVVTVSAMGSELIETTTTTLSKGFSGRQLTDLAQTGVGGTSTSLGVNNLALLAANVTSSGGVGVGMGGSVGGQRPRNNNFMVDGIDNNDKSVTGPQIYISPENVAEFSLLTNQFSAEFNRSNGGQFITITKSGTNEFHGSAFSYFRNRHLNALDVQQKRAGIIRERIAGRESDFIPRSDFSRLGGNFGGPILKEKLFFFGGFERMQEGNAASPAGILAPTASGIALLKTLPGISSTNMEQFTKFVPVAPSVTKNIGVCAVTPTAEGVCPTGAGTVPIPVGLIQFAAPNYRKNNNFVINVDYTQSDNTQHRVRFNYNDNKAIDNTATFPNFYLQVPFNNKLFSYTLSHTFSPKVSNETRLAFRRSVARLPIPDIKYPGLDAFANIGLLDLGMDIGPNPNAPQFGIENNYQLVNNTTWLTGNHSFKFGVDFRNLISPQSFVQRQRGDYQYNSFEYFLRDLSPDFLGERTVGASPYYGNQKLFFPFVQDDWRIRSNVTLNLGLNYNYQQMPKGTKLQALNSISSVPGLIEFREPKAQKGNFAPKLGIAYSPSFESGLFGRLFGSNGQSSIRAGFSMGYDYIFDNLYILSLPPQTAQTRNVVGFQPNFLAGGGIPNTPVSNFPTPEIARANTSAFIPDQKVPYSITYTLSIQREIQRNWSIELRYLGTRGVHLFTQNRINNDPLVSAEKGGLPTYTNAPSQAQLDSLKLNLTQLLPGYINGEFISPEYRAVGFDANIISFLANGNSTYHGFSSQLTKRFSAGLQMTAAYTLSKLIDDTTAEVFSTLLNPRRVQDFRNMRAERSLSALHRPQRFVISSLYDLPFYKHGKGVVGKALGGFRVSGTLTFESGQFVTVLSGTDSNMNGDSAGDRSIINPNGKRGTSTTVRPLRNSAGDIVAYLANDPNAYFIQSGLGAIATSGRNNLQMPGINNLDFSILKSISITEGKRLEFQTNFFNIFNQAQFIPGSPNQGNAIATSAAAFRLVNTVGSPSFNKPDEIFSSNPRVIQLGLKFIF